MASPFNTPRFKVLLRLVAVLCLVLSLCGCQTVSYYSHSVIGHTKLMLARQPVERILPTADEPIQHKLRLSRDLLAYAESELNMDIGHSYTSYVPLKRDYPVWVVVAAPQLSLQAKQWCYLVIGCAAYRGFFSKDRAEKFAKTLNEKGWQTYVGGAAAYSTLGWFADPLLPSMMRGTDAMFAETLFHELAHREIYINGDSAFNEAFATFVGEYATKAFLNDADDLADYLNLLNAAREFSYLVSELKQQLQQIYASPINDSHKATERDRAIATFRTQYAQIKHQSWGGNGYFDRLVETQINNAKLIAYATYHHLVPEFEALFTRCGSELDRFFSAIRRHRHKALTQGCKD